MKQYVLVKEYATNYGGYEFWRSLMYPSPRTTRGEVFNANYGKRYANISLAMENEKFNLVLLKVKRTL